MMNKTKLLTAVALIAIVAIALVGCELSSGDLSSGSGSLKMMITDAPVDDVDEVNITVEKVEVNSSDRGWEEFADYSDDPKEFDLLSLQGVTDVLGDSSLEAGTYEQIRLYLSEASVVIDGEEKDVFIPSEANSGLKLTNEFTIEENEVKALLLDFDARKSIFETGNPRGNEDVEKIKNAENPKEDYIMKPTIRVIERVLSGDIEGVLKDDSIDDFSSYTVKVFENAEDEEELTSTKVDDEGEFKILGLEEGEYTIKIYDYDGEEEVEVKEETVSVEAEETEEIEIDISE